MRHDKQNIFLSLLVFIGGAVNAAAATLSESGNQTVDGENFVHVLSVRFLLRKIL